MYPFAADYTRVVEYAGKQWYSTAGTDIYFVQDGTTSETGCGLLNSNHVFGVNGCAEPACTTVARFTNCPFGGFTIRVFLNSGSFSLGNGSGSQLDLHARILHEFGHYPNALFDEHVDAETPCIMNTVSPTGDINRRFFCRSEMLPVDSLYSEGFAPTLGHLRTTSFPIPGTTWTPQNTFAPTAAWAGAGFVDFERGFVGTTQKNYFSNSRSAIGSALFTQQYPSPSPILDSTGTSNMRPSVAYDFVRKRWFRFWRRASATSPDGVDFSFTSDPGNGASWSLPAGVNAGTSRISTRLPVGVAYEPYSDRIVVMFVASNSSLSVVSTPASSPGTSWSSNVPMVGESAVGPPALACENSAAIYNCQVLMSGTDTSRKIWAFGFGLNVDGSLFAKSVAYNTGGWTDHPIGLTFNGPNRAGRFVATHAGNDGVIHIMSKATAGDWWPPWTAMSHAIGAGPAAVRISESTTDYDILYAVP